MTELVLRNQSILDQLEYVKSAIVNNQNLFTPDLMMYHSEDVFDNSEKYLSEDYLKKHMADYKHEGFPVDHLSIPVENVLNRYPDNKELRDVYDFSRNKIVTSMGANKNAVFLYYPKGGFVGWHTNQNNSGYQFIFSWSEKGDGYFQYYDKKKQEIVRLEDKSGWQARYYHFGKDEPDHCWHSAYTNVPRITICVLFRWWDKPHLKDQILAMKDQLIEDIESEI